MSHLQAGVDHFVAPEFELPDGCDAFARLVVATAIICVCVEVFDQHDGQERLRTK
eukprot:CAMPEP_0195002458 /NCGR_PEP_ID=MMETSP0326_2-20130528/2616_1 /TAXON_ID=2866 ORGANISM="Crypthecodinium cohnii, Strain Seligo" /NCGR_SAMPLE_ID=MMETSP0326_2 /ASSEMBLY_ACC=CAM_ASM_000348 /LENGTH=54 /DNA_ID=CAMNT_0040006073 /DNA_START=619 /DNA_END=780 /DNA_ORIENTATION=+